MGQPMIAAGPDVRRAIDSALALAHPAGARGGGEPTAPSAAAPMLSELDVARPPQRADAAAPTLGTTPPTAPSSVGTNTDDPGELDELAHKLYERIRHRLSRELLLDRERSGLLTGSR
jgi:hypothetical protein